MIKRRPKQTTTTKTRSKHKSNVSLGMKKKGDYITGTLTSTTSTTIWPYYDDGRPYYPKKDNFSVIWFIIFLIILWIVLS